MMRIDVHRRSQGDVGHATEALLTILQEQKIKQAMASSYIAPGALEGRS
jgi:hypothetical protein